MEETKVVDIKEQAKDFLEERISLHEEALDYYYQTASNSPMHCSPLPEYIDPHKKEIKICEYLLKLVENDNEGKKEK